MSGPETQDLAAQLMKVANGIYGPDPSRDLSVAASLIRAGEWEEVLSVFVGAMLQLRELNIALAEEVLPLARDYGVEPRAITDLQWWLGLVENGFAVGQAIGRGELHAAAWTGEVDVARLLLSRHANADTSDVFGMTPLHLAARRGHPDLVELLLSTGVDVDVRDNAGNTPLMSAVSVGSRDEATLHRLISRGASLDAANAAGVTPRGFARLTGLELSAH